MLKFGKINTSCFFISNVSLFIIFNRFLFFIPKISVYSFFL